LGQLRLEVAATVELEDLDELPNEESQRLEAEIHEILHTSGAAMMSYAQSIVPVRTGNLLSSIFYDIDDDALAVTLGATADYASFVEYGTYKMAPRPFLEPSAQMGQEEMNLRIEEAIIDRLDGRLSSDEDGERVTMEIEGATIKDARTD